MTNIEWTDATWNPVTGCTKVSAGCKNCYAEGVAHRFWTTQYGGARKFTDVRTHADRLDEPLRSRKPRRVFVNSMSDLFHDSVPDAFIDQVFAVMALAPRHTFQVLTKRPARMLAYCRTLGRHHETDRVSLTAKARDGENGFRWILGANGWHLPNVWLGVSCENQATADERIPLLLQTPAAVRFLSCEPLLGPIDLAGWGAAATSDDFASDQPATWDGYPWPTWVPGEQRSQIEKFWNVRDGRGPRGWRDDNRVQRTPASGARVGVQLRNGGWGNVVPALSCEAARHGRWLHSWNNIGRVVTDDGEVIYASAGQGPSWLSKWLQADREYRHRLHWVIAGGESGPGARPCDVAWIRSLVEQCRAARVACFVKQLGAHPRGDRFDLSESAFVEADASGWDEAHRALPLRNRKGGDPPEWAADLRVREFPLAPGEAR
jgi:protein gp37